MKMPHLTVLVINNQLAGYRTVHLTLFSTDNASKHGPRSLDQIHGMVTAVDIPFPCPTFAQDCHRICLL